MTYTVRLLPAMLLVCPLLAVACGRGEPGAPPPASPAAAAVPVAAAQAPPARPAAPEVSINAVMVALVDHAAHNLWEVEKDGRAPKTAREWETVEEHAVQVAAAGPAITVGGTGPSDGVWAMSENWRLHAQRMEDAGVAAMRAAQQKDLQALIAANGQLTESCEACHKEFKPSLPTEGIVHQHTD